MKKKNAIFLLFAILIFASSVYAANEDQSLGLKTGESARELKSAADKTLSTSVEKVGEASAKVGGEVQDALKTLQQQWDALAKQVQEKASEVQKQLNQQWQDFNKSFHKQS